MSVRSEIKFYAAPETHFKMISKLRGVNQYFGLVHFTLPHRPLVIYYVSWIQNLVIANYRAFSTSTKMNICSCIGLQVQ